MGRRPKRRAPPDHACMTEGCGSKIPGWKWLCDRCFKALPFERRREIAVAGQEHKPHVVFGLCRSAAGWLVDQRMKAAEQDR